MQKENVLELLPFILAFIESLFNIFKKTIPNLRAPAKPLITTTGCE